MQPVSMTLTRLCNHVRTSSFRNFLINLSTNSRILCKARTTFFSLFLSDGRSFSIVSNEIITQPLPFVYRFYRRETNSVLFHSLCWISYIIRIRESSNSQLKLHARLNRNESWPLPSQESFRNAECVRASERRRDSLRHNSYRWLFHVHRRCSRWETRVHKASFSARNRVIYWRDICRRVVIETTHLRAAKWPLPAVPESGAINFASPLARPAFNLTGQDASLHSLAAQPQPEKTGS